MLCIMLMRTSVICVLTIKDSHPTTVGGTAVRAAGAQRRHRASGGGGTDFVALETNNARAKRAPYRGKIGGAAGLDSRSARRHAWSRRDEPPPDSRPDRLPYKP